jgi:predicted SAM-dependent methyltransferase
MPNFGPAERKSILITAILVISGILIGQLVALRAPAFKTWLASLNAPRLFRNYNRTHPVRKLQIGAGRIDYPSWLNTDIDPGPGEVYLDATKPFPTPDGSIHYVFGEHVIEHLSYDDGLVMLRECYRVLAPGGKVRFATPNLLKYIQSFQEPKSPEVQNYLRRKLELHGWPPSSVPEAMILNMELRSFGHQYIYDPRTLSDRLAQAGFKTIAEFPPGESDDPQLQGIEARHKAPNQAWREMNDYEAMVIQAVRP